MQGKQRKTKHFGARSAPEKSISWSPKAGKQMEIKHFDGILDEVTLKWFLVLSLVLNSTQTGSGNPEPVLEPGSRTWF